MLGESQKSGFVGPLLLTGFEAFVVDEVLLNNPTIELVSALSTRVHEAAILPVEYDRTRDIFEGILDQVAPRIWIGLGLAAHRTSIAIECVAVNVQHGDTPDNANEIRCNQSIWPDGPLAYETTVRVSDLLRHLRANGHDAIQSFHAGTFLCNQVYYQALRRVSLPSSPLELAVFIHVPGPDNQPLDTTQSALQAVLD